MVNMRREEEGATTINSNTTNHQWVMAVIRAYNNFFTLDRLSDWEDKKPPRRFTAKERHFSLHYLAKLMAPLLGLAGWLRTRDACIITAIKCRSLWPRSPENCLAQRRGERRSNGFTRVLAPSHVFLMEPTELAQTMRWEKGESS